MPSPQRSSVSPFLLPHIQTLSTTWCNLSPSARLSHLTTLKSHLPSSPYPSFLPPLLLRTLSHLLSTPNPPSEPLLSAFFSVISLASTNQPSPAPSRPLQLSAAHLLNTLSTTASTHPSVSIRASALSTLAALILYLPSSLLAAFLPGLVSSLTKLLANAAQLHSTLVINALHALSATFHAFPQPAPPEPFSASSSTFQAALHQLSHKPPTPSTHPPTTESTTPSRSPSAPLSFLVDRNDAWACNAGKELSARLCLVFESRDTPAAHTHIRVRIAAAEFCIGALREEHRLRLESRAVVVLRFVVVQFGGDEFEQVKEAVEEEMRQGRWIVRGLRALVAVGVEGVEDGGIEEEVLRRMIGKQDERLWVRLGEGYLRCTVWGGGERIRGVVTRVGVEGFCRLLMGMIEVLWERDDDGEREEVAQNRILELVLEMGKGGLLMLLYGELFRRVGIDEGDGEEVRYSVSRWVVLSFKRRACAALVLQSLVRGAIARTNEGEAHFRCVSKCVKEVLEAMSWFLLPSVDEGTDAGAELVDDTMISLKHYLLHGTAILVQQISRLHEMMLGRPMGSDIILVILLSLLKDIVHGEKAVRKTALMTLRSVATAARCSSERRLIARHLNFLVSRLAGHLEERWAGDVLGFIIGREGDDVSQEATILLEATLRNVCNELAGSADSRALRSLMAVKSVLSSATSLADSLEKNLQSATIETGKEIMDVDVSDAEMADLYKRLFYYCIDDVKNYNQLTSTKGGEKNEVADVNSTDGEQAAPGAFEAIALSTLNGMRDLLVGRPWNVRAVALLCASLAVYMLRDNQDELLPHAANLLPLLPDQFVVLHHERSARDRLLDNIKRRKLRGEEDAEEIDDLVLHLNRKAAELPVVTHACLLLAAFAKCAGSFIHHRFVTLIYPKMRPLLRLASCFPTLARPALPSSSRQLTTPPSHGAMSASDACLEAIASMADVLPEALAPHTLSLVKYLAVYFNVLHDPGARTSRNVGHMNRSMLRYEQERWQKRAAWARSIVQNLKKVNPGDVLVGLLVADHSAPSEITARHPSLHSIKTGKTSPY